MSPDKVPRAMIVVVVATVIAPEYVVPCEHVPAVAAAGVVPSVV